MKELEEKKMRGMGIFFLILVFWLLESCVQGPVEPYQGNREIRATANEWREHLKAGDNAVAEGRYREAEKFYRAAARVAGQGPAVLPISSANPALALTDLAMALLYLNEERYAEAGPLFRDSLPALGYFFGSKDSTVGVNLVGQGVIHLFSRELEKAESFLQRGMPILTHPNQATPLLIGTIGLAIVGLNRPDPAGGRSNLEQALTALEAVKNAQNLSVTVNLLGLASSFLIRLEPSESQNLLKRTLAVVETIGGAGRLAVAQVLENYAVVLRLGDLAQEAEIMETRAKAIRAAQPPPGSS